MEQPISFFNITRPNYNLYLNPPATDIVLGKGVNMNDPLFPVFRGRTFESKVQESEVDYKDDLSLREAIVFEQTDFRNEAERLSIYFKAKTSFANGKFAYKESKNILNKGKVFYLEVTNLGRGEEIRESEIKWGKGRPVSENIAHEDERLRQFLGDHGSHFIRSIQYGQKLTIRAAVKSKEKKYAKSLKLAINALGSFWNASLKIKSEYSNFLRSDKVDISAKLISGAIQPEGSFYSLYSFEAIFDFLKRIKSKKIKIKDGPIQAQLDSYYRTLRRKPKCRDLFVAKDDQPTPVDPKWGVPKGTVIAWMPPAENIIINEDDDSVSINPPQGWALCDEFNELKINLSNRFIMGTNNPNQVRDTGGKATHSHSGSIGNCDKAEKTGAGSGDTLADNVHSHPLSIRGANHLPPYLKLLYIVKT